jgi:hypothetical protein
VDECKPLLLGEAAFALVAANRVGKGDVGVNISARPEPFLSLNLRQSPNASHKKSSRRAEKRTPVSPCCWARATC